MEGGGRPEAAGGGWQCGRRSDRWRRVWMALKVCTRILKLIVNLAGGQRSWWRTGGREDGGGEVAMWWKEGAPEMIRTAAEFCGARGGICEGAPRRSEFQ